VKKLSSPAPTFARRLARAVATTLFAFAILTGSLTPLNASVEARSQSVAKSRSHRIVNSKRAQARKQSREEKKARREEHEQARESEHFNVPGDGEELGEGDNVQKREEWFHFQRAFPFDDIPVEARRIAWESRPTGKLKSPELRGALAAEAVRWTPIGPSPTTSAYSTRWGITSGHVHAIAVKPDDPNVVLIGGASGGIWRSTDAGATFVPATDSQVDLAVSAIAFSTKPGTTNIVYAGMGAQSGFGSYLGTGVLKSTDAGATWSRVDTAGLTKRGRSISIAVDPNDPNRVYLCHFLQQPNDTDLNSASTAISDGFYVSNDGGSTWARKLRGLPESIVVSPADPNVLFLSMARIDPTGTQSAGVYKSTDRGETWTLSYSLNNTTSVVKDCYVAVTPADAQRVYAVAARNLPPNAGPLIVAYSLDNGANWTTLPDTTSVDMGQWGYNSYIYASPSNADTIYVGTRDVWRSTDKGVTWTNLTNNFTSSGGYQPNSSFAHPDQHSFAFAPGDGSTFYIGSDGGLWRTTSGGTGPTPFTSLNSTLTLQQFVGITAHPTTAGITYGGTQDNGTQVRSQNAAGWREFASGDGGRVVVVPSDPSMVFASYVSGTIWRYGNNGSSFQATVADSGVFKDTTTSATDRIPFYPPIVTNGVDSTLYVGTYRLWISTDAWNSKSVGDQTSPPHWTTPGGTTDLTKGSTTFGNDLLSAVGVSRSNPQVIYTGSAQGRLMVSQDGGATWNDITTGLAAPAGTPTRFISSITVDPSNPAVAYVTLSGFGTGHVWKTTNVGQAWADLSGTNAATKLPNIPTSALLLDPAGTGLIYVGTDIGVFRSSGDGNWEALTTGLPPVPVSSITVTAASKIQIGTFGRGAYELNTVTQPSVQFSAPSVIANEGDGRAQINVTRTGDTSGASSVTVKTLDDTRPIRCDDTTTITNPAVAFARCDYATTVQTLIFAAGETSKTVSVPIIDDSFVEPDENVQLALSNPTGATLGTPNTMILVIKDNDTAGKANPIFSTDFFVRMQYLDFLSREPEAGQPWSGVINNCLGSDPACDRISVSANFFRSQEFQLKGLFVFRFYKVSFGRLPTYAEIVADMSSVTGSTTAELIAKKALFTDAWVQRQEFSTVYGGLTNQQFVDTLMNRYNLSSVTTINPASPDDTSAARLTFTRADFVNRLNAATLTRAQAVRAIADSNEVGAAEFNPAFVAMQYFGYLRRDPDTNGYNAWLATINANPADFRSMVNGFMNSTEYRLRFGTP
jgi:photosystem II stability/assembly factor-like uncharacterized protein